MKRVFYRGRFIFIPLAIAAFLALAGEVIMQLWNWLMPVIFHLGVITFWQALGLFILCKLLFGFGKGGHRGFGGGAPWMRHKMEERFRNMTPEEREKFKQKFREHCSFGGPRGFGHHTRDWDSFTETETPKATE